MPELFGEPLWKWLIALPLTILGPWLYARRIADRYYKDDSHNDADDQARS